VLVISFIAKQKMYAFIAALRPRKIPMHPSKQTEWRTWNEGRQSFKL